METAKAQRQPRWDWENKKTGIHFLNSCLFNLNRFSVLGVLTVEPYFSNSSAISTALSAAPRSNWSPLTQKHRPLSSAQSLRMRPTSQLSFSEENRSEEHTSELQ